MEAWITPFTKQCIVTAGVAINVGQYGLVMAYTAILLPQLRTGRIIPIDEITGSWIAAVPGFTLFLGNVTVPVIMGKCGRKVANTLSVIFVIVGWLCIVLAQNVTYLIIGRLLQGLSMGMSTSLGPILIGEYSSPKDRGQFLSTIGLSTSIMTFLAHALGSYTTWDTTAVVCSVISLLDLVIVLYSPESPSWLAEQGRYDKCTKAFHCLRGDTDEEDELRKMIEMNEIARLSKIESNSTNATFKITLKKCFESFISTVQKKEFYKPILIMIHMYMIAHWGGINLLSAYSFDAFHHVIGDSQHDLVMVITLDIQRIISNVVGLFLMRKLKRRTMLFAATLLNIAALVVTAVYSYLKVNGLLDYDDAMFGAFLLHVHTFSVVAGSFPLPMVISGEIFPMRYRSLASGLSAIVYSLNFFVTVKTVHVMLRTVHLYGTYFIYAGVLVYCLVMAWFFLPETKDRTLQDIEEEFKAKKKNTDDLSTAQPLRPLNGTTK
ncbi:unnamed protein product [Arctia plantaginis]|uniref:Major facilitator superfamily (MFS) profile domain-containing protein n=1 Tax=Arctia plantaginis TaxID=874455 RepID=A0A8S1BFS5_ARCPL|nr:unnamed protein product [Arctia plantaginis]